MLVKREIHPALGSFLDDFLNENAFGRELWDAPTKRVPFTNIKELDDRYLIELATPGFKKGDFEIIVENRILAVKSKNDGSKEIPTEKYIHKEYFPHQFSRSFSLPDSVDVDNINGRYEDGILILEILKKEKVKNNDTRKIEIS